MSPTFVSALAAFARHPWLRAAARLVGWALVIGYFAFAAILIVLRHVVLPNIAVHRDDLEQLLSQSLGQPVAIARIDADWVGLRPRLSLHGFEIRDAAGRPALALEHVDAVLGWSSIWHVDLRLHRLEVAAPTLLVRRDPEGRLYVAGLEVKRRAAGTGVSDWLLAQGRIVVRDATITWADEWRQAPPLTLHHVNFLLQNNGSRHRFGLTAEPPRTMAARLDVRGDLRGSDLGALGTWKGEAYAEVDYADLAIWRSWVDYPLELPQGRGGLRLWLGVADGRVASTTADLALADVKLRLGRDLPLLDVVHMEGRLAGRRDDDGFDASAKHLTLGTRDGVRVGPTDFDLRLIHGDGRRPATGDFTASGLDLDAMTRLAAYLPFDAALRERLAALDPHGQLPEVHLAWTGTPGEGRGLSAYSVKARFERLGLLAQGRVPGFAGLSGRVDGSERGGHVELATRNGAVDLPAVFAEPRIALTSLDVDARWKTDGDVIDVDLARAAFANPDTHGEASGRYRYRPGSAGDIDLTARVLDTNGTAVWRYMPRVVNPTVAEWLHGAILAARADEATLKLKGDLDRFPFAPGNGLFEVKGRFHGGTLRYASGWPEIGDITGTLLFEGSRMVITGDKARSAGTVLSGVRCEIPDLGSKDPVMTINGRAAGATADFLRFVETSPVSGYIDHFTDDMRAQGSGQLDLKLQMPLDRMAQTRVDGSFQFSGNRIVVMPGMPPLTEAAGRLAFTDSSMTLPRARANFLGAPVTVDVRTTGNGTVQVTADGRAEVAALRKQFDLPLFDHLAGGAPWRATVAVRKRVPEVRFESNLVGIASSLPPPFNKTTLEPLPLKVERRPGAEAGRELIVASLGKQVSATLERHRQGDAMAMTRGLIVIGDTAAAMPERGVLLAAKLDRLDLDFWRRALAGGSGKGSAAPALPIAAVRLKAGEVQAFGHRFNDVGVNAARGGEDWGAQVSSRELNGALSWRGQGAGRLVARLRQLTINPVPGKSGASTVSEAADELPGLDVEVDQFQVRGKELGKLRLTADNHAGVWDARIDIDNPDGSLSGSGSWKRSAPVPDTRFQFKLTAKSFDRLLTRVGYPDAVRRGTATLDGNLSWNGAPTGFDYPSLSGTLHFHAQNGQFNKLEPGAGRLLGILSLQSLPRRLNLDFRDIFSEGYAFDSINGDAKVARGVVDTRDLAIEGPAAKIFMTGTIDLAAETQNLHVRVQPALGESLAVGAMIASPAAGAVAWLAQKVLKDPLGHVFAYDYTVTGPWSDPKVEKAVAANSRNGGAAKPN